MPVVQKFVCDAPDCLNEALPGDGGTKNKPLVPYGWLEGQVTIEGPGPTVRVVICRALCLEGAVLEAIHEAQRNENRND